MCPELIEGKKDWTSFGFVYEGGKSLPIGLVKRKIGYPTVEPTCSLCHTGSYQASVNDVPVAILAGSANTLDLEKFQWFLYNCATSENFTASKVVKAIEKNHDLGVVESLFYRFAIILLSKLGLSQQKKKYAW